MNNDFRRIFKTMPWEDGEITENKVQEFTNEQMVDKKIDPTPQNAHASDKKEKPKDIPAGYTYFGQFVDHDLTFDETALASAAGLTHGGTLNLRTPVLDLDSVYQGKITNHRFDFDKRVSTFRDPDGNISNFQGSDGKPIMVRDLPRSSDGKANIGDPRNDENAIISQFHLAFMLAHNKIMDRLAGDEAAKFTKARRVLTWLYHWVIRHDFLPKIIREDILKLAFDNDLTNINKKTATVDFGFEGFQIPAEFAFAAYRFGHSMVRDSYQTNNSDAAGFGNFIPIFDAVSADDLKGNRRMTLRKVVQWDWFLKMTSSAESFFPQKAMPINTTLSRALSELERDGDLKHINNFLAARNILRGIRVGMPKASSFVNELNTFLHALDSKAPQAEFINGDDKNKNMIESLWYYILLEAEEQANKENTEKENIKKENAGKLGIVGSSIVAFTFAGLLKNTSNSYFNLNPSWEPDDETASGALLGDDKKDDKDWSLASIIRLSSLPVSGEDF